MAYKFQKDLAILSGALDQEGNITVGLNSGTPVIDLDAASGSISGSGDLQVGGTVRLDGVAAVAPTLNADSLYFLDGDNLMKKVTMSAYATAIAGNGLADSNGVLAVGVDDSSIEINSDALRIKASGVTDAMLNDDVASGLAGDGLVASSGVLAVGAGSLIDIQANVVDVDLTEAAAATIADDDNLIFLGGGASGAESKGSTRDLATLFGGDGLSVTNSTLAVAVSGALKIASDKVGLSGSFAGLGLSFAGGADSISSIALDFSELADEAIASGDRIAFRDATDDGMHAETVDDLAALFAGAGLGASSAVIAVANATNGGIGVQADDIKVDLNDLADADVDEANDLIAIVDANDSNATRKESIVDFVAAIAGTGISAAAGKLSVAAASGVNALGSGGNADATLTESFNFATATITANRTYTMPASAGRDLGDVVTVKLSNVDPGVKVTVTRAGSQTIDGGTSVVLESPGTAVSFKYVAADTWMIF
tara:strand:- start:2802 stop:4256 length:1455 start_codon:yes stop_codon:yes gene_type:complete